MDYVKLGSVNIPATVINKNFIFQRDWEMI
jgi:hypothetical protein